nr:immunoglobulin light chain junction region [Homo sapiens]
LSAASQLAF